MKVETGLENQVLQKIVANKLGAVLLHSLTEKLTLHRMHFNNMNYGERLGGITIGYLRILSNVIKVDTTNKIEKEVLWLVLRDLGLEKK